MEWPSSPGVNLRRSKTAVRRKELFEREGKRGGARSPLRNASHMNALGENL